ncbi:MAG: restriction endonuclease [Candidatus Accumulibacter sp.]|jgi:adenine specific DNA methylase Mod|nr:restriction endonuclease [Accumulibacter sp.]
MTNSLYFGDNLGILRRHIADESVDLIYLDPPFNSKRDYNLLFKTPKGHESDAQITAFEDTWHWGGQARDEFREILKSGHTDVAEVMEALRRFLGENDMMAYLTMMCNRLLEMRRVLKPTGSLYLHCDPTASHYLKIVLDSVFGKENFRNEVVWQRTNAHNFKSRQFPRVHDIVFIYTKTGNYLFNQLYGDFSPKQLERYEQDPETGRMCTGQDLTIIGGDPSEWRGTTPKPPRGWGLCLSERERLWDEGMILKRQDGSPRLDGRKVWLDEKEGVPVSDLWTDLGRIANTSKERLGYPTQKPLALLERIINASSNKGDIVLDPFCGCGTALDAAEKLNRRWIGIDITHLSISIIEKRLKERYPGLREKGAFEVLGVPRDQEAARDLAARDKHQFQLWACSLVGVQPYKGGKKGADQGIDGLGFIEVSKGKTEKVLVSVKGGDHIGPAMVRDLKCTVEREKAAIGLFVTLVEPTKPMQTEAAASGHYESPHHGAFSRIQILTIEELLNGKRPAWPDLSQGGMTFKKAKREEESADQKPLFP